MKTYEKPIVLVNSELSEGVFAASGVTGPVGPTGSSGGASVSSVTMTKPGNPNYKYNTYNVVIKNDSDKELTDWTAALNVSSGAATNAQIYNGWQAGASLNGGAITITPGGGGTIPPGGEITVEVVVGYDGDGVEIGS